MPDGLSVFPNGIVGSNKRDYLFLQTGPLIFLIRCKLSEREPRAAVPYKGIGRLARYSLESPSGFPQAGGWLV